MNTTNNQVDNAGINSLNQENSIQKLQRRRRKPQPCQVLSGSLYRFRHEFPESWFIQGRQRVNGHKDWFFYPPTTDPQVPREEIRSRKKAKLHLLEEEKIAKELVNNAGVNTVNQENSIQKLRRLRRKQPCQVLSGSLYRYRYEFPESWFIQGRQRVDGHKDWFFYPPTKDPQEPREEIRSRKKARLRLLEEENKTKELFDKSKEIGQAGEFASPSRDENAGKEIVLYSPPSSTERNDYYQEVHRLENSTHEDRCIRWNSEHVVSTSRCKNWKNMERNAFKDFDCEINKNDSVRRHKQGRKRWKNMARNVCKDSDSEINKSHSTRECKRIQLDPGEENQPSPPSITEMITNVFDVEMPMADNPN